MYDFLIGIWFITDQKMTIINQSCLEPTRHLHQADHQSSVQVSMPVDAISTHSYHKTKQVSDCSCIKSTEVNITLAKTGDIKPMEQQHVHPEKDQLKQGSGSELSGEILQDDIEPIASKVTTPPPSRMVDTQGGVTHGFLSNLSEVVQQSLKHTRALRSNVKSLMSSIERDIGVANKEAVIRVLAPILVTHRQRLSSRAKKTVRFTLSARQ